jgi:hypothetical protein
VVLALAANWTALIGATFRMLEDFAFVIGADYLRL